MTRCWCTRDTLLVYLNAGKGAVPVVLPPAFWGVGWELLLSTADEGAGQLVTGAGETLQVPSRSVAVFRLQHGDVDPAPPYS